jgi:hypothetical protein
MVRKMVASHRSFLASRLLRSRVTEIDLKIGLGVA